MSVYRLFSKKNRIKREFTVILAKKPRDVRKLPRKARTWTISKYRVNGESRKTKQNKARTKCILQVISMKYVNKQLKGEWNSILLLTVSFYTFCIPFVFCNERNMRLAFLDMYIFNKTRKLIILNPLRFWSLCSGISGLQTDWNNLRPWRRYKRAVWFLHILP